MYFGHSVPAASLKEDAALCYKRLVVLPSTGGDLFILRGQMCVRDYFIFYRKREDFCFCFDFKLTEVTQIYGVLSQKSWRCAEKQFHPGANFVRFTCCTRESQRARIPLVTRVIFVHNRILNVIWKLLLNIFVTHIALRTLLNRRTARHLDQVVG